jgi:cytoskeletal protein CcmA (bactofilin family)
MFEKRRDNQDGSKARFDAGPNETQANRAAASATGGGRAAVIGPRIRINGDVTGDENLLIEGTVEGRVDLGDFRVDVGQSGQVNANIKAKVVKIDGAVEGDISCSEKVILSTSGNVRGNIIAPRVSLEDGAKFKGSIDMDPGEPEPAEASKATKAGTASTAKPEEKASAKAKAAGNGHRPIPDQSRPESLALKGD